MNEMIQELKYELLEIIRSPVETCICLVVGGFIGWYSII